MIHQQVIGRLKFKSADINIKSHYSQIKIRYYKDLMK